MGTIEGGNVLEGVFDRLHRRRGVIASADVLTMNSMPVQVHPGLPDHWLVMEYMLVYKPSGTAYTLASAEQEIRFIYDSHYTLGTDNYLQHYDVAGFLDQHQQGYEATVPPKSVMPITMWVTACDVTVPVKETLRKLADNSLVERHIKMVGPGEIRSDLDYGEATPSPLDETERDLLTALAAMASGGAWSEVLVAGGVDVRSAYAGRQALLLREMIAEEGETVSITDLGQSYVDEETEETADTEE